MTVLEKNDQSKHTFKIIIINLLTFNCLFLLMYYNKHIINKVKHLMYLNILCV